MDGKEEMTEHRRNMLLGWIRYNLIPTKSFNYDYKVFEIKELFERDPNGFPISAGDFTETMKRAGFLVKLEDEPDLCRCSISNKSPALRFLKK